MALAAMGDLATKLNAMNETASKEQLDVSEGPRKDDRNLRARHGVTTPALSTRVAETATERFELRVTRKFLEALDHLSDSEGLSRADIVRRAVGLYARARMEAESGRMVAFATLRDDNTVEVKDLIRL